MGSAPPSSNAAAWRCAHAPPTYTGSPRGRSPNRPPRSRSGAAAHWPQRRAAFRHGHRSRLRAAPSRLPPAALLKRPAADAGWASQLHSGHSLRARCAGHLRVRRRRLAQPLAHRRPLCDTCTASAAARPLAPPPRRSACAPPSRRTRRAPHVARGACGAQVERVARNARLPSLRRARTPAASSQPSAPSIASSRRAATACSCCSLGLAALRAAPRSAPSARPRKASVDSATHSSAPCARAAGLLLSWRSSAARPNSQAPRRRTEPSRPAAPRTRRAGYRAARAVGYDTARIASRSGEEGVSSPSMPAPPPASLRRLAGTRAATSAATAAGGQLPPPHRNAGARRRTPRRAAPRVLPQVPFVACVAPVAAAAALSQRPSTLGRSQRRALGHAADQ